MRDAKHFQDGRNSGFAGTRDAFAFGQVEDKVGRALQQMTEHFPAVAKLLDLMAKASQHFCDGLDGRRAVEFFLVIVGQVAARQLIGLYIESDADAKRFPDWQVARSEWHIGASRSRARKSLRRTMEHPELTSEDATHHLAA